MAEYTFVHPIQHRRLYRRKWQPTILALITALLATSGLLLVTYPTMASWITQYNQSKVVENIATHLRDVEPKPAEQIRLAHEYNAALSSGALLEPNANVPTGDGESSNKNLKYNEILKASPTGLIGRIRISAINLDLPIFHGTDESVLQKGIGHLEGTSLPVGGANTRTVLTGHRGLAHAEMFSNLDKVVEGDTFRLEIFGEVYVYQVYETKVVEPSETEAIRVEPGSDLATLVTCTPLGINSHRILLTGKRVTPTPVAAIEEAGEKPVVPFFPWWIFWLLGGFILIGLYLWRSGYVHPEDVLESPGKSHD